MPAIKRYYVRQEREVKVNATSPSEAVRIATDHFENKGEYTHRPEVVESSIMAGED